MNKKEPICPMLTTNHVVAIEGKETIATHEVFCMKELCAWWIEDKQKCAIAAIGCRKQANNG